ncbi:MAG: hypothetical protein ACOCUD_02455 [Bacillota bacterium]
MFSNYDAMHIIEEFNLRVKAKASKSLKILFLLMLVLFIFILTIVFLSDWLSNEGVMFIMFFFGGISFITLIILIIINRHLASNKITYSYLYPEIIKKINQDYSLNLTYQGKSRISNDFVKQGSIFTSNKQVQIFRSTSGISENNNSFTIYDCRLITGGGQYQQVHHDGLYFCIKLPINDFLQIRSKGKPISKEYSFERYDGNTEERLYIKPDKNFTNLHHLYLKIYQELKIRLNAKRIYLSIIDNNLHFAYVSKFKMRTQKNLDKDKLNKLYQDFISEIKLVDELVSVADYQ